MGDEPTRHARKGQAFPGWGSGRSPTENEAAMPASDRPPNMARTNTGPATPHRATIAMTASRIRLMTANDPVVAEKIADLVAALDAYRAETEQGLLGMIALRRAFAALDALQAKGDGAAHG